MGLAEATGGPVLDAAVEFGRFGLDKCLSIHGFRRARTYFLELETVGTIRRRLWASLTGTPDRTLVRSFTRTSAVEKRQSPPYFEGSGST